ncbi:MAG: succinate dehydrogenase [Bradymonadales bacterium]|nr:succinate dehydrogenase [Bradymonadales bacterium]
MDASIKNTHFLARRIHSLLGLIPVGAFLVFHMWENSQSRFGPEHYNTFVVEKIKSLNYVLFFEIFAIAIPILAHAVYGIIIWWNGKTNVYKYGYFRNWMWWFQRLSGFGILAFLLIHVGLTRIYSALVGPDHLVNENMFAYMQQQLSNPAMFAVYLVGMILAVVHFTNGLWTMGISWGLTTSVRSQKIMQVVWAALAVVIIAMGIHSLVGFFFDHPELSAGI